MDEMKITLAVGSDVTQTKDGELEGNYLTFDCNLEQASIITLCAVKKGYEVLVRVGDQGEEDGREENVCQDNN